MLLKKVERDAEQHDRGNDHKIGDFSHERRNRAGDEQQNDERIPEARKKLQEQRLLLTNVEAIGAELGETRARLGAR